MPGQGASSAVSTFQWGRRHLTCSLGAVSACTMASFVELSTKAKVPILGLGTWKVSVQIFGHLLPSRAFGHFLLSWGKAQRQGFWGSKYWALEAGLRLLSQGWFSGNAPRLTFSSSGESFPSKYQVLSSLSQSVSRSVVSDSLWSHGL